MHFWLVSMDYYIINMSFQRKLGNANAIYRKIDCLYTLIFFK